MTRASYGKVRKLAYLLRAAQDRLVVMKPAGWEVDQDKQENAAASTALKLSSFMCRGTRKSCKIQGGVKDDVISDGFFGLFMGNHYESPPEKFRAVVTWGDHRNCLDC